MASAQVRAEPLMASSGKPTPLNAKAGADSSPAPDMAVRSDSVRPASAAPAARLTATSSASPSAIQAREPATAQPRSCDRYSRQARALAHSSARGASSLPSSAASTAAAPPAPCSHWPRVRSRSSRPTDQAPAVIARMCTSAGTKVVARNCS